MPSTPPLSHMPSPPLSFDGPLGRKIIELHVWAVGEGLRGIDAASLFDGLCRRLVEAGVPLRRGFAGMPTLHPQWGGYGYTWWRHLNAIQPTQFERGDEYEQEVMSSPFGHLMRQAEISAGDRDPWLYLRRRLVGTDAELDFPNLKRHAAAGATDYFAEVVRFGADGDPSRGTGIGYSFTTDRPEGFSDDDLMLLKAVLPVASLAMMAHAGHTIASGLLAAYLGDDAGRRVHAGAVERGSVESIRAVLWYADMRGFTATADATPGPVVIELLDEVFEALTSSLRLRGGQVLKFLGDGMLAIFAFDDATREQVCRQALDAAAEAMRAIDRLNATRCEAGKPAAAVDLALHLGEVLYGNVGAVNRLDFTVIGPAVNEAARIEALCEPLGRNVLVSAELAAAVGEGRSYPSAVMRCAVCARRARSTAWSSSRRAPRGIFAARRAPSDIASNLARQIDGWPTRVPTKGTAIEGETRNSDYWKKGRPYLDGIEYTIIKNLSTANLVFIAGTFDMTFPYALSVPLLKDVNKRMPQAICEFNRSERALGAAPRAARRSPYG